MTYYLPARILFFLRLYWRLYDTLWNSQCLTTWSNRFWLLFCKTQSRWGRNEGKKKASLFRIFICGAYTFCINFFHYSIIILFAPSHAKQKSANWIQWLNFKAQFDELCRFCCGKYGELKRWTGSRLRFWFYLRVDCFGCRNSDFWLMKGTTWNDCLAHFL